MLKYTDFKNKNKQIDSQKKVLKNQIKNLNKKKLKNRINKYEELKKNLQQTMNKYVSGFSNYDK